MRRGRVEQLKFRLVERGEVTPVVLPPWALDDAAAACTTLLFLAPIPTQFVAHLRPWPGSTPQVASSAGAIELTRCGPERVGLAGVALQMRSPRAVVHTLVAVSEEPPPPLSSVLPEREPGPSAELGDPGPSPARDSLAERLRRFEENARGAGASSVETSRLTTPGYVRLALAPGCHRLFASAVEGAPPFVLLLSETDADAGKPKRLPPSESGDVSHELCTTRPQRLLISLDSTPIDAERKLAVAHFPLPRGLPQRFGPSLADHLLEALGGSTAPQQLGPLVTASLGAQGRTPLPRALLPHTCYVAAALALHGSLQALSLGASVGSKRFEASTDAARPTLRLGFCTGASGRADLEVEARGAGVAWFLALFQQSPAQTGLP